jgi:hypothetical protein
MVTPDGNNLVFLMSLPRSGSTLLSILMGGHSRMHAPPEPWFLLPLLHIADEGVWPQDFGAAHAAIATREFVERESLMDLTREFACGAYNRSLKRAGKSVFVDKTPRYYHISQKLDELFPRSRRVWLVRNPFDIAASIKTTWKIQIAELLGSPLTQHSYDFLLGLPHIVDACRSPGPQATVIRYEDLTAQPRSTMERLSRFLGLPFEEGSAQLDPGGPGMATQRRFGSGDRKILRTKTVHTASIGTWEKTLELEELRLLAKVVSRDALIHLGYEHMVPALRKAGVRLLSEAQCREFRKRALNRQSSKSAGDANAQIRQLTELVSRHEADATARLEQVNKLTALLKTAEAESTARHDQILKLNEVAKRNEKESLKRAEQVEKLTTLLKATEAESGKRASQIERLTVLAKSHEAQAIDRLEQVEKLTALLKASQSDSGKRAKQIAQLTAANANLRKEADARMKQIETLTALVKRHEKESMARAKQVDQLTVTLKLHEQESTERAAQITELTSLIHSLRKESQERMDQVHALTALARQHENDALARAKQVDQLTASLKRHEEESTERATQIAELTSLIRSLREESDGRLGQIQSLTDLAKAHEQESAQRYQQIQELSRLLKTAGRDAADRMAQLEKIAPQVSLLEAENRDLRGQLDAYAHWLKDAKRDVETITMAHREAEKTALAAMEEIARLKGPAQSQN